MQICLPAKTLLPQKEMGRGANAVASAVFTNAGTQGGAHPGALALLQAGQVLSREKWVNLHRLCVSSSDLVSEDVQETISPTTCRPRAPGSRQGGLRVGSEEEDDAAEVCEEQARTSVWCLCRM